MGAGYPARVHRSALASRLTARPAPPRPGVGRRRYGRRQMEEMFKDMRSSDRQRAAVRPTCCFAFCVTMSWSGSVLRRDGDLCCHSSYGLLRPLPLEFLLMCPPWHGATLARTVPVSRCDSRRLCCSIAGAGQWRAGWRTATPIRWWWAGCAAQFCRPAASRDAARADNWRWRRRTARH